MNLLKRKRKKNWVSLQKLTLAGSKHPLQQNLLVVLWACCVRLSETPWTVAHQAPLSVGFSRQEYRSGLLFPNPGELPDPEMEPASPALVGGFLISSTTICAPPNPSLGSPWLMVLVAGLQTLLFPDIFWLAEPNILGVVNQTHIHCSDKENWFSSDYTLSSKWHRRQQSSMASPDALGRVGFFFPSHSTVLHGRVVLERLNPVLQRKKHEKVTTHIVFNSTF